jgi:hypothetical protein
LLETRKISKNELNLSKRDAVVKVQFEEVVSKLPEFLFNLLKVL